MNEGRWAAAVAIGSRLLLIAVAVVTASVVGVRSRARLPPVMRRS